MKIIPNAFGRVRYVDGRRSFIIVDMREPFRASVFVPASVGRDYGTVPEPGARCDLGDVYEVTRGWQASRIVKLYPKRKG